MVVFIFTIQQQLEIPSARSCGQLLSGQPVRYGKVRGRGTASPSRTKSDLPGNSAPGNQAGRRVEPAL
jgi:hypothetical protein